MFGKEAVTACLEFLVILALPSFLPFQETREGHPFLEDHHDLVIHLVHLAVRLHKECMSLYFLYHQRYQHSSGFCVFQQLFLCIILYVTKHHQQNM